MTHKFAVVVDKEFRDLIQNDNRFFEVLIVDVITTFTDKNEKIQKIENELLNNFVLYISESVKMFESESEIIFYLEISNDQIDAFLEKAS